MNKNEQLFDCWIQFEDKSLHSGKIPAETIRSIEEAHCGKHEGKWEGKIFLNCLGFNAKKGDLIQIKDIWVKMEM